jgi:adenylate cyclase
MMRAARMTAERTEKAIARDPSNATVLAAGANALALIGEKQRAKDWIERALLLDPDNIIMRYNLACGLSARLDDADGAIEVLVPYFEKTLSATHIRHAEVDPDLDPLRERPRFKELLAGAKARLGLD